MVLEENKAMVRRLMEGINAGDIEGVVDELFAPSMARRVKRLFGEFYSAFPDWHEEIVELVVEGNTVVGRFRCSSTHRTGESSWESPPWGSEWRWKRCYSFGWRTESSCTSGGWRTASTGCGSWTSSPNERFLQPLPYRA